MRTIVLKSLDEIWVKLLRDSNRMSNGLIYRGESKRYETVLPAIARDLPSHYRKADLIEREITLLRRFRKRVLPHLSRHEADLLDFDTMGGIAVMRHYGARTRFLDWTESPAIALYFACIDRASWTESARILCLDAQNLAKTARLVVPQKFLEAHAEVVDSGNVKRVPGIFSQEYMNGSPEFVQCHYFNDSQPNRMMAQQGLVTFSSHPWLDHWQMAQKLCDSGCLEIIVSADIKMSVIRMLDEMNVNHATLFPDAFGAAAYVEQEFLLFLDEVRRSGVARTAPIGAPTELKGEPLGGSSEQADANQG